MKFPHLPSSKSTGKQRSSFGVEPVDAVHFRLTRISPQAGDLGDTHSIVFDPDDPASVLSEIGGRPGSPLTLSIPRNLALAKEIRLPTLSPEEIARMMPFEVQTHSPWSPDEVIFGYEVIGEDAEGYTRVLLMVIPATTVEDLLARLRLMDLQPTRVEISTLSLSRLFRNAKNVAVFTRGPMGMEFTRFHEGQPVFTRGIGPNKDPKEGLVQSIEMDARKFGNEVEATDIIVLDHADLNGKLGESLSDLGRSTVSFEDFIARQTESSEPLSAHVAVGVGAALWRGDPLSTSNLLPDSVKSKYQVGRFLKEARTLVLVSVWFLLLFVGLGFYYFDHLERSTIAAKTRILDLEGEVGDLETKDRLLKLLEGERQRASLALNIVLELYRLTPPTIAINQMQLESRRDLVITGEAPSFNAVFEYVDTLGSSSLFERVDLIYTNAPTTSAEEHRIFRIAIDFGADE